jgi:hypothetical protein
MNAWQRLERTWEARDRWFEDPEDRALHRERIRNDTSKSWLVITPDVMNLLQVAVWPKKRGHMGSMPP